MKARVFAGAGTVACLCAVLAGACRPGARTPSAFSTDLSTLRPPEGRGLRPVALPDIARMNDPARTQMQSRRSALKSRIADSGATPGELATAYGVPAGALDENRDLLGDFQARGVKLRLELSAVAN